MTAIRRIGNLSAMTGKNVAEFAQVYAKAINVGVTNEVAESFETMGVPLRKVIAELRGLSFEEVFDMISERQITAEHLNAALESLTSNGGKFAGATERLSQTFSGLASTLGDNVNMALRRFGEELLPQIKPVLEKLIDLVEHAAPSFQRLGYMLGRWLSDTVNDDVLPALDEFILRIPELRVHLEYLLNKVLDVVDGVMALPRAIQRFGNQLYGYLNYDFDWEGAGKWVDRVERANSAETKRDRELAQLRERMEDERAWAEEQRVMNKKAAEERGAARAEEREAQAAAKRANDERLRGVMLEAEARRKAAQEERQLMEENQRRWENYQDRRRNWERKKAEEVYSGKSLRTQERMLRNEGQQLGVRNVNPETIRARLDELAEQGAKSNEREIAQLERLLEKWDELIARTKSYAATRRENEITLRADALESLGYGRSADYLRERLDTEKRIEELKSQGYSEREAKEMEAAESRVRKFAELQEKINNTRVEFVQSFQAAEGGGGVSYRIGGSQLDETKKTNAFLKRMEQEVKEVVRKMAASSPMAVLG